MTKKISIPGIPTCRMVMFSPSQVSLNGLPYFAAVSENIKSAYGDGLVQEFHPIPRHTEPLPENFITKEEQNQLDLYVK